MIKWNNIPHTKLLVEKQFEYAEIEFNDNSCNNDLWYEENKWTVKQSNLFKEFFIKYLKESVSARREIMTINCNSLKCLNKVYDSWNLMYGFKIK